MFLQLPQSTLVEASLSRILTYSTYSMSCGAWSLLHIIEQINHKQLAVENYVVALVSINARNHCLRRCAPLQENTTNAASFLNLLAFSSEPTQCISAGISSFKKKKTPRTLQVPRKCNGTVLNGLNTEYLGRLHTHGVLTQTITKAQLSVGKEYSGVLSHISSPFRVDNLFIGSGCGSCGLQTHSPNTSGHTVNL